jgi:hypothetical protein
MAAGFLFAMASTDADNSAGTLDSAFSQGTPGGLRPTVGAFLSGAVTIVKLGVPGA